MNLTESIHKIEPFANNLAFRVWSVSNKNPFSELSRFNYFTLVLWKKGIVEVKADVSVYQVKEQSVLFFSPYQPFQFTTLHEEEIELSVINFHPDFFCILKHQKEVSCNGVLFNNLYEPPFVSLTDEQAIPLLILLEQMHNELKQDALAQHDLLLSYLKIFLIHTTRYKALAQDNAGVQMEQLPERDILQQLKKAIEQDFVKEHSPSYYAEKLHISPKALGKLSKKHFNRTLSELIQERLMMEAKRELYLTDKSVKEIAYALGFEDEYYFSRLFKKNTDTSPIQYRKTVGEDQARKLKIEY